MTTTNPQFGNWSRFMQDEKKRTRLIAGEIPRPFLENDSCCWLCKMEWRLAIDEPEEYIRCPICKWSRPKKYTDGHHVVEQEDDYGNRYKIWVKDRPEDMWTDEQRNRHLEREKRKQEQESKRQRMIVKKREREIERMSMGLDDTQQRAIWFIFHQGRWGIASCRVCRNFFFKGHAERHYKRKHEGGTCGKTLQEKTRRRIRMTTENVPAKAGEMTRIEIAEKYAKEARQAFLAVIPDEKVWVKEVGFAIDILRASPALQACDPLSIRQAVRNVAATGVTLNPSMQMAYLIPRDGKCCLDFSYRGLIKILTDSGSVKKIDAHVIFDFDERFEFWYENGEPHYVYEPSMKPPEGWKGTAEQIWEHLKCVVTVATLSDGSKSVNVLPKWKVEKTARTSKAWGNKKAPWETHTDEQIRKTGIKYHYKTLPQTEVAGEAIQVLNEHEGLDLQPEPERTKQLAGKISELQNAVTAGDGGQGTASGTDTTQQRPACERTEPICVCKEMARESQIWDCPKHGRVSEGK